MAGGAGVEWYFGFSNPNSDLNLEDFRSRDALWDQTRIALEFFQRELPFITMGPLDQASSDPEDYVFADPGVVCAVYLPQGGESMIDLVTGSYAVRWYNPRSGGALRNGTRAAVSGGEDVSLGRPPEDDGQDWVALVTRLSG